MKAHLLWTLGGAALGLLYHLSNPNSKSSAATPVIIGALAGWGVHKYFIMR